MNRQIQVLFSIVIPPSRVSEYRETLHVQGGILSPVSLLPASFFPVETSQSRRKKGGLQTAFDSMADPFIQLWVFKPGYHVHRRTLFSVYADLSCRNQFHG